MNITRKIVEDIKRMEEEPTVCWDCHPDPFLYQDPSPERRQSMLQFTGSDRITCEDCGSEF